MAENLHEIQIRWIIIELNIMAEGKLAAVFILSVPALAEVI